ncbi:MAG: hypothetical protein HDS72_07495 [Bacteroidales bacterium]|nr:hypothetical protein [Bacteroidales bacterium]
MKSFLKFLYLLPMMLFAASCSNGDEPNGLPSGETEATKGVSSFTDISDIFQPVHSELLSDLLAGKQAMTFGLCSWDVYERWEGPKFEYFDRSLSYGLNHGMPKQIIFSEGKVWAPYSTFSLSLGPSKIGMAWDAYKKASGEKISLYVGNDFKFEDADRSVHFLGREFVMLMFNRNSFIVAESGTVMKSRPEDHEMITGEIVKVVAYERTADVAMLEPGAIGFESNEEVAAYIIAKCRELFGDVINLNEVYAPNVILDNPYINLDDLEKSVAAGNEHGDY